VVTRSGSGPEHANIERVATDATDAGRLTALTEGAVALYNCASPAYHQWLTDWPPLAEALLTAAERTGAVLTVANNLYGYDPTSGVIGPETPLAATHPKLKLRADMYREALARHQAGRIRMVEVRASDYLEANSILSYLLAKPLQNGKRAYVPAPLDVKHSWTAIADVARLLALVSGEERAWGQAWLTPTTEPLTIRELADRFVADRGLKPAKLTKLPYAVLWGAGLFDKMSKELRATHYQFAEPFVMDSTLTEKTFGLAPTPIDEVLRTITVA
jgi:nucleoside-diphosphate-sugar epimerase